MSMVEQSTSPLMRKEVNMNDEFFITKTVDTGSEGSKSVRYHVYARNCDGEINEISYEELIRFNQFLTNFLKGEEGSHE